MSISVKECQGYEVPELKFVWQMGRSRRIILFTYVRNLYNQNSDDTYHYFARFVKNSKRQLLQNSGCTKLKYVRNQIPDADLIYSKKTICHSSQRRF